MEELKFTLTKDESQLVINALLKEPMGVVMNVFAKIQDQAAKQMGTQEKQ